jgi:hypothetical protein
MSTSHLTFDQPLSTPDGQVDEKSGGKRAELSKSFVRFSLSSPLILFHDWWDLQHIIFQAYNAPRMVFCD